MVFKNMIIGTYTKIINNYSDLENIKNDLNIQLTDNYDEDTCYYASQYDRLYLLCLRNSNNFTTFSPSIKKEKNDIEIWEVDSLSIDVKEIESQNTDVYLYGTIFTIPKFIHTQNIYMNGITKLGDFISDECMITKEEALDIGRPIYSHWDLTDNDVTCKITYTYPGNHYPVYNEITTFQKIWQITNKDVYKDICILINANTGEIIHYY